MKMEDGKPPAPNQKEKHMQALRLSRQANCEDAISVRLFFFWVFFGRKKGPWQGRQKGPAPRLREKSAFVLFWTKSAVEYPTRGKKSTREFPSEKRRTSPPCSQICPFRHREKKKKGAPARKYSPVFQAIDRGRNSRVCLERKKGGGGENDFLSPGGGPPIA